MTYSQNFIDVIEKEEVLLQYPKVKEKLNLLKETVEDVIEHLWCSKDQDAEGVLSKKADIKKELKAKLTL
ncbi:hypothetical protein JOD43_000664 [Pullulanibacillus pueri]|uniref:Uncharacterized protein n=1 Tax=Pullulanibacillus pueri TaxID=1437324 RepID=A0A8J2ZYH9_9BACL|nr:hypothetical protein [Pullulanibacillus pueri]MBM7680502.1 hypothetical protein [Pullulanibacillus pueri]GGH86046.1 hypothetical protein GCM10007096_32840 [Pullulanibacillus pueri]